MILYSFSTPEVSGRNMRGDRRRSTDLFCDDGLLGTHSFNFLRMVAEIADAGLLFGSEGSGGRRGGVSDVDRRIGRGKVGGQEGHFGPRRRRITGLRGRRMRGGGYETVKWGKGRGEVTE